MSGQWLHSTMLQYALPNISEISEQLHLNLNNYINFSEKFIHKSSQNIATSATEPVVVLSTDTAVINEKV